MKKKQSSRTNASFGQ